jgi:predicted alpha/beta hydrolase
MRETSEGARVAHVGHSCGGQLLPLVPDAKLDAVLLIASGSGYYGHWSGIRRPLMAALWAVTPGVVAVRGYLPMRALGQGEDIPPNVARQWAEWGRDPRYVGRYLAQRDGATSSTLACPIRAYAFTDDAYAPIRAARALLAESYERTGCHLRVVAPTDLGASSIGHFSFFRESVGAALWHPQRDWLVAKLTPHPSPA